MLNYWQKYYLCFASACMDPDEAENLEDCYKAVRIDATDSVERIHGIQIAPQASSD